MKALALAAVTLSVTPIVSANTAAYYEQTFEGYRVVLNCKTNGAEFAQATLQPATPNRQRESVSGFSIDESAPADCRQVSTDAYPPGYHRGQLIDPRFLGQTQASYSEAFSMTNVLPMTKELNIGAWHESNRIIECLRDKAPITIFSGPIWDGAHRSTSTMAKHGVPVPSGYWRILKQGAYQIGWIFPNSKIATRDTLRNWEASVEEIETALLYRVPSDLEPYVNYRPDEWYNTDCQTAKAAQ